MSYLNKIDRALDYIEANLRQDLSLVEVAKIIAFSPYHFHYVFSVTVGETFKDYIRKRRLTEAAHELRSTETGILDLALTYGFESQESFTRAFKKMFKQNPGAYRKAIQVPRTQEKQTLGRRELEHRMKGIILKQKMQEMESFYLVGMEYLGTQKQQGEIGKLWQKFIPRISEIKNLTSETRGEFGCCYATPEMIMKDQMHYIAGLKVKDLSEIPTDMVGVKIPKQNYAVFTHKGPVENIALSYDYIYGAWFPKSGMEPADGPDFELYDERFKLGEDNSELDLYVPVI